MQEEGRALALRQLQDLEDWSKYILEALTKAQRGSVSAEILEGGIDQDSLRKLREVSWSLFDQLHLVKMRLEFSRGEHPAGLGCPR